MKTLDTLTLQIQRVNELTEKVNKKLESLSAAQLPLEEKAQKALAYNIVKAALVRTQININTLCAAVGE